MNREGHLVVKRVYEAWNATLESMRRMSSAVLVRPQVPDEVFTPVQDESNGVVKLQVAPIVFNVPERANAGRANLYIVVSGEISFVTNSSVQNIRTNHFGTRVAYFRHKGDSLEHIYGVHYDMDECSKGHPVFHSQLGSQMEFVGDIEHRYRIDIARIDCIKKLCKGIRTPTAQMDLFSVFTQICADHLLWKNSPTKVEVEFEKTRQICSFFTGAAHKMPFLQGERVSECYRSIHWYGECANEDSN